MTSMRHFSAVSINPVCLCSVQIVLCVLLAALFLAIGGGVFSAQLMRQNSVLSALVFNDNAVYTGFLVYWSYIILLSPAMPIALYISLVPSTIMQSFVGGEKGGNAHLCACVGLLCMHVCVPTGLSWSTRSTACLLAGIWRCIGSRQTNRLRPGIPH